MPTVPDIHRRGTRAAQATLAAPPLTIGTLYFVTDESVTERWNGTAWESYSAGGGGSAPSAYLDLTESTPAAPAVNVARVAALDDHGFTQIGWQDSAGRALRLVRDNVAIFKVTDPAGVTPGQVVYLSGASGANPEVKLARADASATMPAVGFVLDAGAVNAYVRVLLGGTAVGFNTAAITEGARVFVSPTTAGAITMTLPTTPNLAQRVGVVTRSHATQGEILVITTAAFDAVAAPPRTGALGIVLDGGGSAITTGVKGFLNVPFACTITGWTLLSTDAAATAGSIVIDVWKDTYANYPPTVADTITASAKPTLSAANKNTSTTLTGWTTAIAAGDVLGFNVDSAATVVKVTLSLTVSVP